MVIGDMGNKFEQDEWKTCQVIKIQGESRYVKLDKLVIFFAFIRLNSPKQLETLDGLYRCSGAEIPMKPFI